MICAGALLFAPGLMHDLRGTPLLFLGAVIAAGAALLIRRIAGVAGGLIPETDQSAEPAGNQRLTQCYPRAPEGLVRRIISIARRHPPDGMIR